MFCAVQETSRCDFDKLRNQKRKNSIWAADQCVEKQTQWAEILLKICV